MSKISRTRPAVAVVTTVVAALALLGLSACEPARADDRSRPVVLVHGWNAFGGGSDCESTFGPLKRSLRSAGFTGPMVTIAYYDSDRNCDVDLRDWGNISNSTAWPDLSKALSKYLHATYTKKGATVDLVGHSMGGLIIRGAVYGSAKGQSGFSAPVKVEDAVTLAGAHDGAAWYSNGCLWGQCSGLKPGSSEIKWVQQDGNPQGPGGTDWTVIGSPADNVVPVASALKMSLPDARRVNVAGIGHSDYTSNAGVQNRVAEALAKVDR